MADHKGNIITFDYMFMSGDALSICQAVKANRGKVIVQVDRLVDTSRPRNAIIPGRLVDDCSAAEPQERNEAYTALTGSFLKSPYEEWHIWSEKIDSGIRKDA